jgi:hypothetical protein
MSALFRTLKSVHVLGANGFPVAMYRPFMNALAKAIGNNASVDGSDVYKGIERCNKDWNGMIDDVIQSIEARGVGPVYGVGHSLGKRILLYVKTESFN